MLRFQIIATEPGAPMDTPPFSASALYVAGGLIGLILVATMVLHFIDMWQKVVTRRGAARTDEVTPPVQRYEVDLSGMVASKDFDQHKKEAETRARGLEEQISGIRHEWREKIQPLLTRIEDQDEAAQEWRLTIGRRVEDTAMKLAATEREMTIIARTQTNMDSKIDRLIERHIPQKA